MPALVKIEGIGETFAGRLAEARIGTTQMLLKRGATRQGRKLIAKQAGVPGRRILDWVNRADLFRVHGIGEEYSDLLEASGVDTVVELATRNAQHLHATLSEVNAKKKLVRKLPAYAQVQRWVKQAKQLPRVVEY